MNDSGLLKELLDKVNQQLSLIYTVGAFLIVNIVVGIINFLGQRNLKNLEVSIHKKNLRESKKIELFHELYKKLDKLRLIYNDPNLLQSELTAINNYINENAIYLGEEELKITEEYCDYFTRLIVSIRHKDVATEKMYMDRLKREFNK
jgi:hypothetical protein